MNSVVVDLNCSYLTAAEKMSSGQDPQVVYFG